VGLLYFQFAIECFRLRFGCYCSHNATSMTVLVLCQSPSGEHPCHSLVLRNQTHSMHTVSPAILSVGHIPYFITCNKVTMCSINWSGDNNDDPQKQQTWAFHPFCFPCKEMCGLHLQTCMGMLRGWCPRLPVMVDCHDTGKCFPCMHHKAAFRVA